MNKSSIYTSTSTIISSDSNFQRHKKPIGRDFAPIFMVLSILSVLMILIFMNTFYNCHLHRKNTNIRHTEQLTNNNNNTDNSVYFPLTTAK